MSAAGNDIQDREASLEARLAAVEAERTRLEAECADLATALGREVQARQEAEHEREQFRKLYALVQMELERLKRQLFGKKAEKVNPAQVQLAFAPVLEALERAREGAEGAELELDRRLQELRDKAAEQTKRRNRPEPAERKPHGRRSTASFADLPTETVVLEPRERLAPGGELLIKIGEEVSVHVDRRPASTIQVRVVRPKYKRPNAPAEAEKPLESAAAGVAASDEPETAEENPRPVIIIAPLPERPIPRGIAGPGLLAHVLVQKYGDHIPLHRQEGIFRREGLHLPRSTLCGWVQGTTTLLSRVVDAMLADARQTALWWAVDATGAMVLAKDQCKRGHFWVIVAARDHVLFRYTKSNDGATVAELLAGYQGPMIADASSVFHELYRREPGIEECGCWSHARRNFFEALSSDRDRALVGIGFIGLLYDAHRNATDPATDITDGDQRRTAAEPVLRDLYTWIDQELPGLDEDAPVRKAMQYLVNHKQPLTRFLHNSQLRLDNNLSELELRREVVGANNWLFCGSEDGAHWNTVAVSLIASCQLHGIEPWEYLRDVLTLLPSWPQTRVLELAPKFWNQTRQKPETQELLASLRLLGRNDVVGHVPDNIAA